MAARSGTGGAQRNRAYARLGLALLISALAHLIVVWAVGIKPRPPARVVHSRIEARLVGGRLEPVAAPSETPAAELAGRTIQAPAPPPPQPAPAPVPELPVPPLADPTYYPPTQLDVRPQALHGIYPAYPTEADRLNKGGRVVLLLLIEETGAVSDVSVVQAQPEGYFEQSAIMAFRHASFSPAMKDGRAVKARLMVEVLYEALPEPPAADP